MSHRRDIWREALDEHLENRGWDEVQRYELMHQIGHSATLSAEAVLEVLEYQQSVDERIQAEKDHDRVFIEGTDLQNERFHQQWPGQGI